MCSNRKVLLETRINPYAFFSIFINNLELLQRTLLDLVCYLREIIASNAEKPTKSS